MTWLKVDDRFPRHHKVMPLSDKAFRMHVAALCHCAESLSDGRVTERAVRMLLPVIGAQTWKKYVNELVSAGLWTVEAHGWSINDFLDYNPSSVKVKEQRLRNAERQEKHRRNAVSHSVTNTVSHGVSNAAPSRPVIETEQPQAFVPQDVTSEVDAGRVIDLSSILKDVG